MGIIAIIYNIFSISIFSDVLYFGNTRFRGLMNDPNYFSILQLAGLTYFIRKNNINHKLKIFAFIVIVVSIILSGSKTGFVAMLIYGVIVLFGFVKKRTINTKKLILFTACAIVIVLFSNSIIEFIKMRIPVSERVFMLFEDFDSAFSASGSSRNEAWSTALDIIGMTPIFGIGIGTYTGLSTFLFNSATIAHNTYLQMMVEWGICFTFVFLVYLFLLLYRKIKEKDDGLIIIRDILIIFLAGSLAISFNNARLFWIAIGILVSNNFDSTKKRMKGVL